MMLRAATCAMVVAFCSFLSGQSTSSCKAVTRYGVSGCEMLPDQSCPTGYHKQAVDPPDPRMKAPSYLMCVADKPQPKEQPPSKPPKTERSR
jgi:hypothetical protein